MAADRGRVLDGPAGEEDVAGGHQRGPPVHRAFVHLQRHADAVRALEHHDLHAVPRLGHPLVADGGEVEAGHHHPRARRGSRGPTPPRRARSTRWDGARSTRGGAQQPAVAGAQLLERRPPGVVPGRGATGVPEIEIGVDPRARAAGEGAQGTAVQVDAPLEDREFGAVARRDGLGHAATGSQRSSSARN